MVMQPKDIALAPIYLYQGRKLKRTALRLPEAQGARQGCINLSYPDATDDSVNYTNRRPFNLMMAGDSSAAGVGVESQQDALLGHLLSLLDHHPLMQKHFSQINWRLEATSGHTSFDILRRLYLLPSDLPAVDIMVVMVGVNDTTSNVLISQWQKQLEEIIDLSLRKFSAKHIIFPNLPPMAHMPAIPKPLNGFIGAKADLLNNKLNEVSEQYETVETLTVDFSEAGLTADEMFSEDGFHPNSIAYAFWAQKLAEKILAHLEDNIMYNGSR